MKGFYVFLLLCFSSAIFAQNHTENIYFASKQKNEIYILDETNLHDFAAFAIINNDTSLPPVKIRFSKDKIHWQPWIIFMRDEHLGAEHKTLSSLVYSELGDKFFQLDYNLLIDDSIYLNVFYPNYIEDNAANEHSLLMDENCNCPQPTIIQRSSWCPNNNCPPISNPIITSMTHIIVHHSAGTNTSSNWGGVVQSIWNHHVNNNGWSDIGYNWLIDPNGNIYNGRGEDIKGAHFCGHNSHTQGICVMGNFTDVEPQESALLALRHLMGWKLCKEGFGALDVAYFSSLSQNLKRISGHRDGCATSCPGDSFYPLFTTLRNNTNTYMDSCALVSDVKGVDNHSFMVRPNPMSDYLNITQNANDSSIDHIIIYSMLGLELVNIKSDFDNIDVSKLESGVYYLKIFTHRKNNIIYKVYKE